MVAARQEHTIHPIYVVHGKDRRRVADEVAALTERILVDADVQVALSSYDGATAELAEVMDDLRTLPFLSPRRLVVVKQADEFIKRYRRELEEYLESPCATGVLLLMAESFAANTRLAKRAVQIGEVLSCGPLKGRELGRFLTDYAQNSYQLRLEQNAAELLIALAGDEAGRLAGEIDKLATYIKGPDSKRNTIRCEDVQELVGNNRQLSVFNVIDAMTASNKATALSRLDRMLAQDRNAQYQAVGAFAWHFRRLYAARVLVEKRLNDQAIARQLRIWPRPDQFMRQVKQLTLKQIGLMLCRLMTIDLNTKTGAGDVKTGLEKLIVSS